MEIRAVPAHPHRSSRNTSGSADRVLLRYRTAPDERLVDIDQADDCALGPVDENDGRSGGLGALAAERDDRPIGPGALAALSRSVERLLLRQDLPDAIREGRRQEHARVSRAVGVGERQQLFALKAN